VLKWIVERLDGQAAAMPSAIGNLPTRESFDGSGMDLDHRRRQRLLTIDLDVWAHEAALIEDPPRSAPTCPRRCGTCTTPDWTGSRKTVPTRSASSRGQGPSFGDLLRRRVYVRTAERGRSPPLGPDCHYRERARAW
jgi:hypothetical protein